MSEIEKKPRVGIALLNMVAALADRRRKEAWQKERTTIETLEGIAKKMNLEKLIILGVSPEVIEPEEDGRFNIYKETTFDDSWSFSNAICYGGHLWAHTTAEAEDDTKPLTPHLEYLGTICCNGFFTSNITQFVKKNGEPVKYDLETFFEFEENPENFEIIPANCKTTFDADSREDGEFLTRVKMYHTVPYEQSYFEPCFKRTSENMLSYLADMAKRYDIRQVITCTDNTTRQDGHGGKGGSINMLDSTQISEACNAPVVMILNNVDEGNGFGGVDLSPKDDGFEGVIISNEMFAFGLERGMSLFSEYINKEKEEKQNRRKELVNHNSGQ